MQIVELWSRFSGFPRSGKTKRIVPVLPLPRNARIDRARRCRRRLAGADALSGTGEAPLDGGRFRLVRFVRCFRKHRIARTCRKRLPLLGGIPSRASGVRPRRGAGPARRRARRRQGGDGNGCRDAWKGKRTDAAGTIRRAGSLPDIPRSGGNLTRPTRSFLPSADFRVSAPGVSLPRLRAASGTASPCRSRRQLLL